MHFPAAFTSILAVVLVLPSYVLTTCVNPPVRREWRTLSKSQQLAYIAAVKCLQSKPGVSANLYPGVRNRFDDYQGLHINQTDFIHFVGYFQPWHRYFVASYESDLRTKCGWTGGQPYWDWTLDAVSETAFVKSPVFDTTYGFGGNGPYINSTDDASIHLHIPGKTGGGCVSAGPFKNMIVHMGPGFNTSYAPQCLTRDFSPWLATQKLTKAGVIKTLTGTDFRDFDIKVQGDVTVEGLTYHGGGHLGVGGDLGVLGNVYSSPGDPLFYLHHSNMDRLWWEWQQADSCTRLKDISGPDTQFANPFNFFGDIPYKNITLDYKMDFFQLNAGSRYVQISDVMNIKAGKLCYTFA